MSATIPTIYLFIILAYSLMIAMIHMKNSLGGIIVGMFMMILSVYTWVTGVDELRNTMTIFFSAMTFAFGVFGIMSGAYEFIKESVD